MSGFLAAIPLVNKVIDAIFPDKQAAADAKLKVLELASSDKRAELDADTKELQARAEVVKTEAASSHWLAANWRPIIMLTFGGLIVARWFGWSSETMSETEILAAWDMLQLGLGGYVIGRSAEKIIPAAVAALKGNGDGKK